MSRKQKSEYSWIKTENGTPLRQMTITESFKKAKISTFKMDKPFGTGVVLVISSDSEDDTPPHPFKIEFKPSPMPLPQENSKSMIGVYLPSTSTPLKSRSEAENIKTPSISGIESPSTTIFPKTDFGTPNSTASNDSNRTLPYDYTGNTFDGSTVPFSPGDTRMEASSERPLMVLNDSDDFIEDTLHSFPSTPTNSDFGKERQKKRDDHLATDSNNPEGSALISENINKKPKRKYVRRQSKKSVESNNERDDHLATDSNNPEGSALISENINKKPKRKYVRRQSKKSVESNNESDDHRNNPKGSELTLENINKKPKKYVRKRAKDIVEGINKDSLDHPASCKANNINKIAEKSLPDCEPHFHTIKNTLMSPQNISQKLSNQNDTQVIVMQSTQIRHPTSSGWLGKQTPSRKRKSEEHDGSINKENSKNHNIGTDQSSDRSTVDTLKKSTNTSENENDASPEKRIQLDENICSEKPSDIKSGKIRVVNWQLLAGCTNNAPNITQVNTSTVNEAYIGTNVNGKDLHSAKKVVTTENRDTTLKIISNISITKVSSTPTNKSIETPKKLLVDEQKPSSSKSPSCDDTSKNKRTNLLTYDNYLLTMKQSSAPTEAPTNQNLQTPTSSCSRTVKNPSMPTDQNIQTLNKAVSEGADCSKSLTDGNITTKTSPSTPEKGTEPTPSCSKSLDMSPTTNSTNKFTGSPRKHKFRGGHSRGYGSPGKGSPEKQRDMKTFKAKEGKQLQLKQLDLLVGLFKTVSSNRHLRSLLNTDEVNILSRFMVLGEDAKYITMKLFVFKRTWYSYFKFCNKAQLVAKDDKHMMEIFETLQKERFVDTEYMELADMIDLLNELPRNQIVELMDELKIKPNKGTKDELIQNIVMATNRQTTLTKTTLKDMVMGKIKKKFGFAIKIKEEVYDTLYHSFLLATFTNLDFENIQIYFRNMIHFQVTFPRAPIEDCPVFFSRENFISYGQALKVRRELDDHLATKTTKSRMFEIYHLGVATFSLLQSIDRDNDRGHRLTPHLRRFSAEHVYKGVLSTCCDRIFTKQNGQPQEVKIWLEYLIERYPNSGRLGKWYQKLIWLHMKHLDQISYPTAAELLFDALETKRSFLGERAIFDLEVLGRTLNSSKKYKLDQIYHDRIIQLLPREVDPFPEQQIDAQCIRSEASGKKRIYYTKSDGEMTGRNVEQVALDHYCENGYPYGQHCEGSLVKALFMLYFWDIIYRPETGVPGTFISKLQSAPLDMFTSHFYKNRREAINERLLQIDSQWSEAKLIEFCADNWQKHAHESAAFGMVMDVISKEVTVEVLVTVIGRKVLAKIFERLAQNIRENSSGMPDLLVWNTDQGTHKFVEVKGEGDRLAGHQILWLDYLRKIGASIEVCWVHSTGSKRKKIIKKVPVQLEEGASTSKQVD